MKSFRVTKHASDGRPPYSYDAQLVEVQSDWIVVDADWTMQEVVAGPVSFKPGDRLTEFFALNDYFNAFLIKRENDDFGGWYCNITHPTIVEGNHIHWHDLYLDIVVDESGLLSVEDEDELAASGMQASNPELYEIIIDARDRLIALFKANKYPFSYES